MHIVKVQHKGQMTIPRDIRSQVGLTDGDLVEVKAERGRIVLTPKLVIDRTKFPDADNEYTPAGRRIINARLARSAEDIKKGRTYGPFSTADEMIASLKRELKKRAATRKSLRSR